MEVRTAEHLGMCFGVKDAVDLALRLTRQGPITILGDLAHNADIVAKLDAAGAARARKPDEAKTKALLVTAHGTSNRMRRELRAQGFQVHDATCPLVRRAHLATLKLVADGYHPVIVGQAGHVEVRGLVGDLTDYTIVMAEEDFAALEQHVSKGAKLGVVSQTTQPLDHVLKLVNALRRRFPKTEIRFVDTVCQPTKDRQEAMRLLAHEVDAIVVVGGPESNNSRKLVELAEGLGRPAVRVSRASELRREWFAAYRVVGLTAGTSTPDAIIEEVRSWLEAL